MTDEITPALTAEEWERIASHSEYLQPSTIDDLSALEESDIPRAVAYANSLLADDSPYKLTRGDAAGLMAVASFGLGDSGAGFLEGLAMRLAALLPPE